MLTCPKAPHDQFRGGYLHGAEDDSPYDVDGQLYCGRCHCACNARSRQCENRVHDAPRIPEARPE